MPQFSLLALTALQGCKDFSMHQDTPPPYQPIDDDTSTNDTDTIDTSGNCVPETCDDGVLEESRTTNTQGTCISFTDKSSSVGLTSAANHAGVSVVDYDQDGKQDIFLLNYSAPNEMLRNTGGNFQDTSAAIGLNFGGDSRQAVWNDYDGDGDLDLFLVGMTGSALYKNSAGHFSQTGLQNTEVGKTAAWLGSNIILGTDSGLRYYKNVGGDTFSDITSASGLVDINESAKIAIADYDGDGLDDIYVANVIGQNRLFRNLGNDTFTSTEDSAHAAEYSNESSSDAEWINFQGESKPSIYVSDYNGSNQLYVNQQDGTFSEDAASLGIRDAGQTTAAAFSDILDENKPSLFLGRWEEPNLLYLPILNDTGSIDHYEDYAHLIGMDASFMTMGAEWMDYDNDGDDDLAVADYNGQLQLFENNTRTINLCPTNE
jgi:hypothetical protein